MPSSNWVSRVRARQFLNAMVASCDDTEHMDMDLPGDSTVATGEKTLLQNMQ